MTHYRACVLCMAVYLSGCSGLFIPDGWRCLSFEGRWGDRSRSHVPPAAQLLINSSSWCHCPAVFQHLPTLLLILVLRGGGVGNDFPSEHSDALSGLTVEPLSFLRPVLVCLPSGFPVSQMTFWGFFLWVSPSTFVHTHACSPLMCHTLFLPVLDLTSAQCATGRSPSSKRGILISHGNSTLFVLESGLPPSSLFRLILAQHFVGKTLSTRCACNFSMARFAYR